MTLHRNHGFTLIEVLAALAVLALSMSASLYAATFYAGTTRELEDRMIASWLAHNVMVETQLEPQWPSIDKTDQDQSFADIDWVVERVVEGTPDDYIRRVTVRVRRERDDEDAWLLMRSAFLAEPAPPLQQQPPAGQPGDSGSGAVFGP